MRPTLGDVHLQPRLSLRLCLLHQRCGLQDESGTPCSPEQFVEETVDLSRRYNLEMLWVVDDNFLVDLDRARAIGEGLVRAGAEFQWSIQATTNLTSRLSLEDLKLLRRAGLHQICQGVDSGSPKILKAMNKTFQNFDDIYESAARCLAAGMRPSFNIIFAYPGEGPKERRETMNFIMDVCRRFPGTEFWTNIFTPYPGTNVMNRAAELGIEAPTSFEKWAEFFPRYTKLPWLNGRDHEELQIMRDYLRIAFDRIPIGADRADSLHPPRAEVHLVPRPLPPRSQPLPLSCRALDQ